MKETKRVHWKIFTNAKESIKEGKGNQKDMTHVENKN